MTDPGYPSRALGRGWRVGYKRSARHLMVLLGAYLVVAVAAAWVAIGRLVGA